MSEKSRAGWIPLEAEGLSIRRRSKTFGILRPCISTVLLGVVMVVLLVLGRSYVHSILAFLSKLPLWQSVLLFQLFFIIVSFPFTSGYLLLNITAGYLYGFRGGFVVSAVCAAVAVPISLVVCRRWFFEAVQESLGQIHLKALSRIMDGCHGFRIVCLTRLTPIPFGLQNGCLAITEFPIWSCCLASALGLLPAQVFNSHVGSTVRSMSELYTHQWDSYLVVVFQFVVLCSTVAYVAYLAEQELAYARQLPSPSTGQEKQRQPHEEQIHSHNRMSYPSEIQFI